MAWARTRYGEPQRRARIAAVAAMAVAHLGIAWGVMQIGTEPPPPANESAPLFVDFIQTAEPVPRPPAQPPAPRPKLRKPPPKPLAAPRPKPAPSAWQAEPVPEEPPPPEVPVAQAAPAPPAPPAPPPPPPAPRTVAITSVQYAAPPTVRYPAASRRLGETGRTVLRVLIDTEGHPARVEVQTSSGYERLDDAALQAMRAARFKPYMEGGRTLAVWVHTPIVFTLEN